MVMKKLAFFVTLFLGVLTMGQEDSAAQSVVGGDDGRMTVSDSSGRGVVDISASGDGDDSRVVIRVASMEVVMRGDADRVQSSDSKTETSVRTEQRFVEVRNPVKYRIVAFGGSNFQSFLEVGINTFPVVDYSMYPNLSGDLYDFMDLRNGKSLQWAFSLFDVTVPITDWFSVTSAIQLVFNEYVFSRNVRLVKEGGMLVPQVISPGYKKSKISTSAFQIPVLLNLGRAKSFHFSAGLYGGVTLGSHSKIKFPKEKVYNMYVNPFYAGATFRVGFRGFYVYCNYGLTGLFKHGKGPVAAPLTVGIGF